MTEEITREAVKERKSTREELLGLVAGVESQGKTFRVPRNGERSA